MTTDPLTPEEEAELLRWVNGRLHNVNPRLAPALDIERLLATLDAARADTATLDVERLAKAMLQPLRVHLMGEIYEGWPDDEALCDLHAYVAPAIAREYAALANVTVGRNTRGVAICPIPTGTQVPDDVGHEQRSTGSCKPPR